LLPAAGTPQYGLMSAGDAITTAPEVPTATGMRVVRNTVTLRRQVLEVMRNAILSFQFKPGDTLL